MVEVTVKLNDLQQARAEHRAEQADLPLDAWVQQLVDAEIALAFANSDWTPEPKVAEASGEPRTGIERPADGTWSPEVSNQ